jgi:predicted AlkP superfamily pyrophosphatase or phosphodiesterase
VINVVGLCRRCIGEHTPYIQKFLDSHGSVAVRPQVPAVTCTMQATYLTGKVPSEHGIVGNGWYDRELDEVHFWKQSNHLVRSAKLWETIREERPDFTCAKLFWWYNMYSSADFSITPRPMYPADGRKVFDVYTHPMGMREEVKSALGSFPFHTFWGPGAGLPCSQWIADSCRWVEEKHRPDLTLLYLPHLDYNFQRHGPDETLVKCDLLEIDQLVENLVTYLQSRDIEVTLLSEYGITPVDRPVHVNRIFREEGWLTIKDEMGLELLDCGASQTFAVVDHQVAHVYVRDAAMLASVRQRCAEIPGVESVLHGEARRASGLDHDRAGDLILIADARSWFTYYYWEDDARAPDFARCVDIHRKPGYDPVELFLDPQRRFPKLAIAGKLLKKKLGFRMLMDLIPLDAHLVKGSHGRVPEDPLDWPILLGAAVPEEQETVNATDVYELLRDSI